MRFGVFGTGYWAREVHAAGIVACPGAELAGVWGRDPAKAKEMAEGLGVRAYDDADALIDAVDAIAVALPPDVQADLAVRAANAGRHLLIEKPVALSSADADRVVEAVQAAGVRALVFHTARFVPEIVDWVRAAQAEEWHGGAVTWLSSIFEPGNPFGESPWRRAKGALWDIGPHALDFVISTLGPVTEVTPALGRGDTAHLVVRHESGASSTLTVSLTAPPAAAMNRAWIYGPAGVRERPDAETTAAQAHANAVSALVAESDVGHPSDVVHGAGIVRVLEQAERRLAGPG